jgi:HAD superfamily hydrolase (TIGR01509 family)
MGKRVSDNLKARRDGAGILESEIPFQKLLSLREGYFLEYMEKEAIILEGAGEIVKRMKSKNILSAIVSSGTNKYLYLVLKKFNLEDSIDFIVSGDDVLKGKPDPECYLTAFNKAIKIIPDLKTEECLVFEDTEAGVTAGKNAGMKVVLIPTLTSIMPTVAMPDYIIDSLLNFKDSMLE